MLRPRPISLQFVFGVFGEGSTVLRQSKVLHHVLRKRYPKTVGELLTRNSNRECELILELLQLGAASVEPILRLAEMEF